MFNVEKYIEQCLQSIINQTYEDIEILVVNDASTDQSKRIVKKYVAIDSRIKLVDNPGRGVADARNFGIKQVTGSYIMFVDSDDWLELNTCEILLNSIIEKEADIVMGSYVREFEGNSLKKCIFDRDITFEGVELENLHRRLFGLIKEELYNPENLDCLAPVCMKLYKSSLIKDNNICFEDLKKIGTFEDGLFNIQVFQYAKKIHYIDYSFYHYRKVNNSSITTRYKENLHEKWFTLFDIINLHIKEHRLNDNFREALQNRIALSILGLGLNIYNCDKSFWYKLKEIKKVLQEKRIHNACQSISLKYFPIHWRLFYFLAKYNCSIGVGMMLFIIKKMRGRR